MTTIATCLKKAMNYYNVSIFLARFIPTSRRTNAEREERECRTGLSVMRTVTQRHVLCFLAAAEVHLLRLYIAALKKWCFFVPLESDLIAPMPLHLFLHWNSSLEPVLASEMGALSCRQWFQGIRQTDLFNRTHY